MTSFDDEDHFFGGGLVNCGLHPTTLSIVIEQVINGQVKLIVHRRNTDEYTEELNKLLGRLSIFGKTKKEKVDS